MILTKTLSIRVFLLSLSLLLLSPMRTWAIIDVAPDSFIRQQARAYWWGHTPTTTVDALTLPQSESAFAQQSHGSSTSFINSGTTSYTSSLSGFQLNASQSMNTGGFLRSTAIIRFTLYTPYDFSLSGAFVGSGATAETGFLNVHIKNLDTDTMVFENNQSGVNLNVTGGSPTGFPFGTLNPGNYELHFSCQVEGGSIGTLPSTTTGTGNVDLALNSAFPTKIDIVNPGFEDNVLSNGASTGAVNGWTISGTAGTFNPTSSNFNDEAPQGANTAFMNTGNISQLVPEVLTAGNVYALIVEVGDRGDQPFTSYELALMASGTAFATDSTSATPPNDGFATAVLNFVATAGHPFLNQILTVRISSGGSQSNFDAVRLVKMPVSNAIENITQGTVYASVQGAINEANNGDIIEIPPGQYCEHLDLKGKIVNLRGTGDDPENTIITGLFTDGSQIDGPTLRCVNNEPTQTLIENLTLTGGNGIWIASNNRHGGGAWIDEASPTFRDVIFRNNTSVRGGGAYLDDSSSLFDGCVFTGNTASIHGAGLYQISNAQTVFSHTTFSDNIASSNGGAILIATSEATIDNCSFVDNQAGVDGGAISNDRSTLIIDESIFTGNSASDDGGVIWNTQGTSEISDCSFTDNSSVSDGGAIYLDVSSQSEILGTTFELNVSGSGGAILTRDDSDVLIGDCDFNYNFSQGSGGAVYLIDTVLPIIAHSRFYGNTSGGSGSAMVLINSGCDSISQPVIDHCLFVGNEAGTVAVINNNDCANSSLTHNVFVDNDAGSETDVLLIDNSDVRMHNSIFWGNDNGGLPDIRVNANATAQIEYNLVEGGFIGTGNIDADPNFLRLPNDGGDGYGDDSGTGGVDESLNDDFGDLRLTAQSAAIDAGNSLFTSAVDLDGNQRAVDDTNTTDSGFGPVRFLDLGAYEYNSTLPSGGIIGDLNGDGVVNVVDYVILAGNYLTGS